MNELSSQFYGKSAPGVMNRKDAAPDPFPAFDDQHRKTGLPQLDSGSETGNSCTDHDDVKVVWFVHSRSRDYSSENVFLRLHPESLTLQEDGSDGG